MESVTVALMQDISSKKPFQWLEEKFQNTEFVPVTDSFLPPKRCIPVELVYEGMDILIRVVAYFRIERANLTGTHELLVNFP